MSGLPDRRRNSSTLSSLGVVDRVDFVLLTHIHMDHAGGFAEFLDHFPLARAVCHSKAISHLVDPSKLLAGEPKNLRASCRGLWPHKAGRERTPHFRTLKPEWKASTSSRLRATRITISVLSSREIFLPARRAAFMSQEKTGSTCDRRHPPVFFLRPFVGSIDRLLTAKDLPMCYAHFGRADRSHPMLKRQRAQFLFWESVMREESAKRRRPPSAEDA